MWIPAAAFLESNFQTRAKSIFPVLEGVASSVRKERAKSIAFI